MESTFIYGKHAVMEALERRPEMFVRLYVRGGMSDPKLGKFLKRIPDVQPLNEQRLPGGIPRDAVHQGFVAEIDTSKLTVPFKDWIKGTQVSPETSVVVLGEVQDPHNVGAIIRSAAAFGVGAVLIPKHRQSPVTGTVIKVSAGTAFTVPLVAVGNVNNTLRELKEAGFWVYGLDMKGDTNLHEEDFPRPSAFVVGNEGQGIRQKTHELCDSILEIPMHARAESLNASVSTATVLYGWSSKHPGALNSVPSESEGARSEA